MTPSRFTDLRLWLVSAAAAAFAAGPVHAQAAAPPEPSSTQGPAGTSVGEVIVTAMKRSQSVRDVPAAIVAFTGKDLAASGISSSFDLQQKTPGLDISFSNRETNVAIRGVSNNVRSLGADPSTAVHLDGVYLPQSSMILTDFFDINRIEVLKGPQGTLYGRNATAGVINVIPNRPVDGYSAEGFVGTGSFNLIRSQLALNAGTDIIAARVALDYARDSGFTANIQNGTHLDTTNFRAVRAQLRVKLADDASVNFLAQAAEDHSTLGYFGSGSNDFSNSLYPYEANDPFYHIPITQERVSPRQVRLDAPVLNVRSPQIYAATFDWSPGPVVFRSITAGTIYHAHDASDSDATGANLETQVTRTDLTSFSQELQLSGVNKSKLDWVAGLYFYTDAGQQSFNWQFHGLNCAFIGAATDPCTFVNLTSHNKSMAIAGFGQATYHLNDQWSITLGGRYTDERKRGYVNNISRATTSSAKESDNAFTPKGQIEWKPRRDLLLYAGVSQGFKSGGIAYTDTFPAVFRPEKNTAYEAGVKSAWFDRRLTLDASAFYYNYTDLQLKAAVYDANHHLQFITSNAANAKVAGVDLDSVWRVTDRLSVSLDGEYLYTRIGHYLAQNGFTGLQQDLNGSPLPLSPRASLSLGLDYDTPFLSGQLHAHADYNYRSRVIFPATYAAVNNFQPGYGLVNLSARWTAPGARYYVEVIGRNVTNKLYLTSRADYAFSNVVDNFGPPANVEARLGFKF